jgi:hypothetical protein
LSQHLYLQRRELTIRWDVTRQTFFFSCAYAERRRARDLPASRIIGAAERNLKRCR